MQGFNYNLPKDWIAKMQKYQGSKHNTKNGVVFLLLFIFFPTETDAHRRSHRYTCN